MVQQRRQRRAQVHHPVARKSIESARAQSMQSLIGTGKAVFDLFKKDDKAPPKPRNHDSVMEDLKGYAKKLGRYSNSDFNRMVKDEAIWDHIVASRGGEDGMKYDRGQFDDVVKYYLEWGKRPGLDRDALKAFSTDLGKGLYQVMDPKKKAPTKIPLKRVFRDVYGLDLEKVATQEELSKLDAIQQEQIIDNLAYSVFNEDGTASKGKLNSLLKEYGKQGIISGLDVKKVRYKVLNRINRDIVQRQTALMRTMSLEDRQRRLSDERALMGDMEYWKARESGLDTPRPERTLKKYGGMVAAARIENAAQKKIIASVWGGPVTLGRGSAKRTIDPLTSVGQTPGMLPFTEALYDEAAKRYREDGKGDLGAVPVGVRQGLIRAYTGVGMDRAVSIVKVDALSGTDPGRTARDLVNRDRIDKKQLQRFFEELRDTGHRSLPGITPADITHYRDAFGLEEPKVAPQPGMIDKFMNFITGAFEKADKALGGGEDEKEKTDE